MTASATTSSTITAMATATTMANTAITPAMPATTATATTAEAALDPPLAPAAPTDMDQDTVLVTMADTAAAIMAVGRTISFRVRPRSGFPVQLA